LSNVNAFNHSLIKTEFSFSNNDRATFKKNFKIKNMFFWHHQMLQRADTDTWSAEQEN
jgi:hypothetical protein